MDSGELLKLIGISGVGGAGGISAIIVAAKMLIPAFAKARLDANSLGSASTLIDDLRAEKVTLQEQFEHERKRHDDSLKTERDRSDTLRITLEATLRQLYEVREELSKLSNENIKLTGQVASLQRQVNTLKGVKNDEEA